MKLEEKSTFKGWTIPGPRISGPHLDEIVTPPGTTLDALSGHYRIFQLKDGHRFSTDDLLVAWFGTTYAPRAEKVLDLGSGIGSVGMMAAWRLPGAQFTTIEAQDPSVELARLSAKLNQLDNRYEIRHFDFRDPLALQPEEHFDLILGSPPYFPLSTGELAEHPQKVACRFEVRGDIQDYCRIASAHLSPGAVFAAIFPVMPEHQKQRALRAGTDSGLTLIRFREVILKEGEAPLLGLFLWMKSEHLPPSHNTWKDPPLTIRTLSGHVHPEYQTIKLSIGFPP